MPQWGAGNSRAIESRMRKKMEKDRKQKELEEKRLDEYWKDDDKKVQAKIQRKIEAENKKQQKLDRKKELRELYGEEEKALKTNKESKSANTKITQAQILQRLIEEKKKEMKDEKKKTGNVNVHEMELEDNINHIIRDEMNNYDECINATGIDNIISSLGNVSFEKTKKVKAAYKKYEEENLPLVKEEYKNLKLSQYKQILWKKFKKSADNPMNQKD
ncbi:conserved protein, unknown function [Plasmodium chabaudi chabaudi]|uniref:Coiled-coil domain-containing protein 124, putative n=1 Tax=Plasmodium chabaudi chabaudi TaxID=31271 RepID=A0A077XD83_PLACU|nr:coiled-coil domain-containing protein 124, putative [Plasmodium chabaudi chabaudi]SCM22656.1 conserved protein, unknown function [Plasmodium chabaudi chabaudi]SCN60747.1 conserved protein, unknown function [Plasmodium chabaudi chabaudi]VTZ68974.1 coiled-coil domain-containing protein 124, putative [Plasmodium chabaudi chabaudi]|eukprot:XP_016655451.1 conserved protein, unknown function [Plasmodium chabaudi chabaudi]